MPLSDNEITALLKKAEAFAQSCNNDEALKAYDIIIEQEPDQARAWEGKGDALTKIDRHEDARTAYEKAAKCYKTGKDRARCYFNIIARFLFAIEVTKEIWSAMEDNLVIPLELRESFKKNLHTLSEEAEFLKVREEYLENGGLEMKIKYLF